MTTLITKERLKTFNDFGGDLDGLLRMNKTASVQIFNDDLTKIWSLISSKLQDLQLISNRLASYDYTKNSLAELEKITDEESFKILTKKISFYDNFQKVRLILEKIKSWTSAEKEIIWAGYVSGQEFLHDLEKDIEKIKFCDFDTLEKLVGEFAAASTYQEVSLVNGWEQDYLKIAGEFDNLYKKIISNKNEK